MGKEVGVRDLAFDKLLGRVSAEPTELTDHMRLVGVAAFGSHSGIIALSTLHQPQHLLTPDHTGVFFRIHAHVLSENPIVLPPAQAGVVGEAVDRR